MIPEAITRRYYQIGEVAQMFGRQNSTIRYWCQQFGIEPHRKANGCRLFTVAQFEKLSAINALTQAKQNFTIVQLKNRI
jgi:DNA-binding transcriptional MerR regulator